MRKIHLWLRECVSSFLNLNLKSLKCYLCPLCHSLSDRLYKTYIPDFYPDLTRGPIERLTAFFQAVALTGTCASYSVCIDKPMPRATHPPTNHASSSDPPTQNAHPNILKRNQVCSCNLSRRGDFDDPVGGRLATKYDKISCPRGLFDG